MNQKKDALRRKIAFLGRMIKMQKVLRENNENIVKLKKISPEQKIPKGVIMQGKHHIENSIDYHIKDYSHRVI